MSDEITITGPWMRDERALDPGVRVRHVQVGGRGFEVRNVSGPGWWMHVRPLDNPHHVSDMADWEDWPGVAAAARRCVAVEKSRAAR